MWVNPGSQAALPSHGTGVCLLIETVAQPGLKLTLLLLPQPPNTSVIIGMCHNAWPSTHLLSKHLEGLSFLAHTSPCVCVPGSLPQGLTRPVGSDQAVHSSVPEHLLETIGHALGVGAGVLF